MIRKPNSIIVLLFIQNDSQFKNIAKTCLPPSMLSSSSIVHGQGCPAPQIFSKQQMQSPLEFSSCCSCHVFSHYFAQFLDSHALSGLSKNAHKIREFFPTLFVLLFYYHFAIHTKYTNKILKKMRHGSPRKPISLVNRTTFKIMLSYQ